MTDADRGNEMMKTDNIAESKNIYGISGFGFFVRSVCLINYFDFSQLFQYLNNVVCWSIKFHGL